MFDPYKELSNMISDLDACEKVPDTIKTGIVFRYKLRRDIRSCYHETEKNLV